MNSLYGLAAVPTAMEFLGGAAKVAATPFELMLQAANQATEQAAGSNGSEDGTAEAATLEEQVAQQLQQLLESLGVQAGDQVTLSVSESGDILADHHPLANEIEAAVNDDGQLKESLTQLVANQDLFNSSPFRANDRLEVETSEDGAGAAILEWR
jgi:hypothetical protein